MSFLLPFPQLQDPPNPADCGPKARSFMRSFDSTDSLLLQDQITADSIENPQKPPKAALFRLFRGLRAEDPGEILGNPLISSPSSSKYLVVFLLRHRKGHQIQPFFLDFVSKRWVGLQPGTPGIATLPDLTVSMSKFRENTVFLLFREFLLDRAQELEELKLKMSQKQLFFAQFCSEARAPLISEGMSTMKTGSGRFPRINSNQELTAGFLSVTGWEDLEIEELGVLANRVRRVARRIRGVKGVEEQALMAQGFCNYLKDSGKQRFSGFLREIRQVCRSGRKRG